MFSAIISAWTYSASTLVNQTRTTVRSVMTVPAHKINILSPKGASSAFALTSRLLESTPPPDQCVTYMRSSFFYLGEGIKMPTHLKFKVSVVHEHIFFFFVWRALQSQSLSCPCEVYFFILERWKQMTNSPQAGPSAWILASQIVLLQV